MKQLLGIVISMNMCLGFHSTCPVQHNTNTAIIKFTSYLSGSKIYLQTPLRADICYKSMYMVVQEIVCVFL